MTIIPATLFIFAAFDLSDFSIDFFTVLKWGVGALVAFIILINILSKRDERLEREKNAVEAAQERAGRERHTAEALKRFDDHYRAIDERAALAQQGWPVLKAFEEHRILRAHVAQAARRFVHGTWATYLAQRDLDFSPPPLAEGFQAFYANALRTTSEFNNAPADIRANAFFHAWNEPALAEAKALLGYKMTKPGLQFPPAPTARMVDALRGSNDVAPLIALRDGYGLQLRLLVEARGEGEHEVLCRPPHPEAGLNRYLRLEFDRLGSLKAPTDFGYSSPIRIPKQLEALALQYPRPPTADLDRIRYLENTEAEARFLVGQLRRFRTEIEARFDYSKCQIPLYIDNKPLYIERD